MCYVLSRVQYLLYTSVTLVKFRKIGAKKKNKKNRIQQNNKTKQNNK